MSRRARGREVAALLGLLAALQGAPRPVAAEGHPARGRLAGQLIESRVDSEEARRYLEGPRGGLAPAPLAEILAVADRRPLDADLLAWLSGRLSTDFASLLILHYIGVPLSGQVSREIRGRYRALAELGPNDGLTLLADELVPGGASVTEVGLDHFYRDPRIDLKTLALTMLVLERLPFRREPGETTAAAAGAGLH